MKFKFWQRLICLVILGSGISALPPATLAAQFDQQEIDQSRFIILAAPGGEIGYKLLILEQINDNRPCWSEAGSSPSMVEPLLLSFDFTGICNRIVDSNGFSVRTAGQDQGLAYSLRILRQDNDLVLVAASNTQRNVQVEIGRTYGLPNGFSRIILNDGWRLTRRAFNGRAVGHVYLTADQPIETMLASGSRPAQSAPASSPTQPMPDANVIPVPSLPPAINTAPIPERPAEIPGTLPLPAPQSQATTEPGTMPPPPPTVASVGATSVNAMPVSTGTAQGGTASRPVARAETPSATTLAQAETYQVVVVADSAELQDKVRTLAPSSFLTTINGQVVMQVGVFQDRQQADQLQQRLSLEGLSTAVIPVR
jgi:N-acetylmuramoyl-L-alanine amidase